MSSDKRPRDQFEQIYVARCRTCGACRFKNSNRGAVENQVSTPGVWDVQERLSTLASCCRSNSVVEEWICAECARVPGPLARGSYDASLPDEDCSRCGRPYRGVK